jgi:hypothetical protein
MRSIGALFKRARRRVQGHVRRMRGWARDRQPIGPVTHLEETDGFGFRESPDGREIYFYKNGFWWRHTRSIGGQSGMLLVLALNELGRWKSERLRGCSAVIVPSRALVIRLPTRAISIIDKVSAASTWLYENAKAPQLPAPNRERLLRAALPPRQQI